MNILERLELLNETHAQFTDAKQRYGDHISAVMELVTELQEKPRKEWTAQEKRFYAALKRSQQRQQPINEALPAIIAQMKITKEAQ